MGVIPATIDQVMVGILPRSRLEAVKVLFFVGVNEGTVPQRKSGEAFLSDRDREAFKENGHGTGAHVQGGWMHPEVLSVPYDVKPSLSLVLTYAGMSPDGKSQSPPA